MRIELADADATGRLGAAIAPLLEAGESVLLYGPLGMGKSTLARGLIRAMTRPDEDVPSPTFTLVQFYPSDPPVPQFTLYRRTRPDHAFEIGLDEARDEGCAVIEWPERLGDDLDRALGPDRLHIHLEEHAADTEDRPQAAGLRETGCLRAHGGRVATINAVGSWEAKIADVRL